MSSHGINVQRIFKMFYIKYLNNQALNFKKLYFLLFYYSIVYCY